MSGMDPAFRERLERVYAEHPVTADAVLSRVLGTRGTTEGISARDLAEAAGGGVTDQNHSGGAAADRALAAAVGLDAGWTVLDIGTGIGGTPRLLAEEFGCRCHGVELTTARFQDAVRLTRVTGLDDRVTFSHGDFMEIDIPGAPFDLAVTQGAVMHFTDVPGFLRRVAGHLRPGGRLAVEDSVIARPPSTPDAQENLRRLLTIWNGEFQRSDEWPVMLAEAGFRFDRMEDLTPVAVQDFEGLLDASAVAQDDRATDEERRGWELGLGFLRSGALASVRILATRL